MPPKTPKNPAFERAHPRVKPPAPHPGRFRKKAEKAPEKPTNPVGNKDKRIIDKGNSIKAIRERLAAATLDELLDAFGEISARAAGPGRDQALVELDAELARREGVTALTVDPDPGAARIDALIASGYSYVDAWAEVRGGDPAELAREERLQLVDAERRPGERRAATVRRMYAERTYLQWLQAEDDTRGNLLNAAGRAKGIDPVTLWFGPAARARKYASDELKAWWEDNGGRVTMTEYRATLLGDRATAQAARLSGQGKDYGL